MTSEALALLELAKKLTPSEREALAEAIYDTLEDEPASLSPERTAEVKNGIAQLERDDVKARAGYLVHPQVISKSCTPR